MKLISHRLNSPLPISRGSMLTALWDTCVCARTVCVYCGTFCSVTEPGLDGGPRLGVCSDTFQPNTENVLPALANIFSNTLHSSLTCTTTSAKTTLLFLPPPIQAALRVAHKCSIVPLGFFHLCIKILTMHLIAACASSGQSGSSISHSSRVWMNIW